MQSLARHFYTMACNNAWANHRLLRACSLLSQSDLIAPRTGFFPSIKATLNHIVTVDLYYVDALERSLRGQPINSRYDAFFDPEEPFETAKELSVAQHAVDRRLIDACLTLTDAELDRPVLIQRATAVQTESVSRLLSHVFEHQIHHRGQAHAMLSGTAMKPPQLDEFFCANDADLRALDLAELGLSEAEIWSGAT